MELSAASPRQDAVIGLEYILRELDEMLTGVLRQSVAFDKPLMQVSTSCIINTHPHQNHPLSIWRCHLPFALQAC